MQTYGKIILNFIKTKENVKKNYEKMQKMCFCIRFKAKNSMFKDEYIFKGKICVMKRDLAKIEGSCCAIYEIACFVKESYLSFSFRIALRTLYDAILMHGIALMNGESEKMGVFYTDEETKSFGNIWNRA